MRPMCHSGSWLVVGDTLSRLDLWWGEHHPLHMIWDSFQNRASDVEYYQEKFGCLVFNSKHIIDASS